MSFEDDGLSEADLRQLVYNELKDSHPEVYEDEKVLNAYDTNFKKVKNESNVAYKIQLTP